MGIRKDIYDHSASFTSVFNQFGISTITSSSLSRILEFGKTGFFIMSAARPEFDEGPVKDYPRAKQAGMVGDVYQKQFDRYKALQKDLISRNIGYTTLIGKWKDEDEDAFHEELSVFVPFKNLPDAVFANDPFEFRELAMALATKYDQTSFVYGAPPSRSGEGVDKVELWFTGLRDEAKDTHFEIGSFHPSDLTNNYLSVLMRANHVQKGKAHTRETKRRAGMPPMKEQVPDRAFKYESVGIRWRDPEWTGQVAIVQKEFLFLTDAQDNIIG